MAWHQRLGLDALTILKNRDHRVVFITTALFSIPLAAFYPYAPPNMRELGMQRTTAWMSLGQVTEIIAMFGLGALILRWRLKWIIACGLGFGILRFALSALNDDIAILADYFLEGDDAVHRGNPERCGGTVPAELLGAQRECVADLAFLHVSILSGWRGGS